MSRSAEHRILRMKMREQIQKGRSLAAGEAVVEEGEEDGGIGSNISQKNLVNMKADGNFNMNPLLVTAIKQSAYLKTLARLTTYQQIVDEIYYKVESVEPWSSKATRQASKAFCLLYRLLTIRVTKNQMQRMLDHTDSPFIRAVGFLYLRFTCPAAELWDWVGAYLLDTEKLNDITLGDWLENLLVNQQYFDTRLPRIPKAIETNIKVQVLKASSEKKRMLENEKIKSKFVTGTQVTAKFSEDGKWYSAVIDGPGDDNNSFWVTYTKYGNREQVFLGAIKLEGATSASERRSRSRSRDVQKRRRSRSRSRDRRRSRSRERRSRSRDRYRRTKRSRSPRRRRSSRSLSPGRRRKRSRSPRRRRRRSRSRSLSSSQDRRRRRRRHRSGSEDSGRSVSSSTRRRRRRRRLREKERNSDRNSPSPAKKPERPENNGSSKAADELTEEELLRKVKEMERESTQAKGKQYASRSLGIKNSLMTVDSKLTAAARTSQPMKPSPKAKHDGNLIPADQIKRREPTVDPKTLARRQAELERIKQRYE